MQIVKKCLCPGPVVHQAEALKSWFLLHSGVFWLLPGWDASPLQVSPGVYCLPPKHDALTGLETGLLNEESNVPTVIRPVHPSLVCKWVPATWHKTVLRKFFHFIKCSSSCPHCDWSVWVHHSSIKHAIYVTRMLYQVIMHVATSWVWGCGLSLAFYKRNKNLILMHF